MIKTQGIKLVQVSASLVMTLGGPVAVVKGINKYLNAESNIINLVFGTLDVDLTEAYTFKTFANNRYGFTSRRTPKLFRDHLATADIVLIHGYYLFSTILAIWYAKKGRIFVMPHGSLERYQSERGFFRKRLFDHVFKILLGNRRFTFLVGSNSEVDSVTERFPNSRVLVVGLGVEEVSSQRRILNDYNRPVELLCMSRISEKKRIDLCIRAVAQLNSSDRKFILKIYGSGDKKLEDDLKELAQRLDVSDSVHFCGFANEEVRHRAFSNSDIFLLPSENENFAVAVAESIFELRPVVVSRFVAMHEFVDEFEVGITLRELDSGLLALAILNLIQDYDRYVINCESNRELLSWRHVSQVWLRTLLEDWN